MRLHACTDRFENGAVFLPEGAFWLDDYIAELTGFPGTRHDDQVDSTTQALDYLREPDFLSMYLRQARNRPLWPQIQRQTAAKAVGIQHALTGLECIEFYLRY